MKHTKRNTILLLLVAAVIMFFLLKDDFNDIVDQLILANKSYILICFILMFGYWLLRSLALYLVVKKHKKNIKFSKMLHQILITQFFNGITPFSSGGEPMQIYMLKKSGIKVAKATNIIVQEFIMYQSALIIMGLICLIFNQIFNVFQISAFLGKLILLGFIINIVVGLVFIFVSLSKKFSKFVVNLGLKIGTKVRLIKDVEKTTKSWNEKVEEYNESGAMLKENKGLFISCVLVNFLALLVFYLIPFFVFLSLGYNIGIMEVIVASAYILLVGNFVPIPGGSGGIEYAFLEFFKIIVSAPNAILKSALIIWRGITYYIGIIIGGVAFGFFKGEGK